MQVIKPPLGIEAPLLGLRTPLSSSKLSLGKLPFLHELLKPPLTPSQELGTLAFSPLLSSYELLPRFADKPLTEWESDSLHTKVEPLEKNEQEGNKFNNKDIEQADNKTNSSSKVDTNKVIQSSGKSATQNQAKPKTTRKQAKAKSSSKSEKKAATASAAKYQSLAQIGSSRINDGEGSSVNSDSSTSDNPPPSPAAPPSLMTQSEVSTPTATEVESCLQTPKEIDSSHHTRDESSGNATIAAATTLPDEQAQPRFGKPTAESPLNCLASLSNLSKSEALAPATTDVISSFNPPNDIDSDNTAPATTKPNLQTQPTIQRHPADRTPPSTFEPVPATANLEAVAQHYPTPPAQATGKHHPVDMTSPSSSEALATPSEASTVNQNYTASQHVINLEKAGDQSAASTMGDASASSASISVPTNLLQPTQDEQPTRFRSLANDTEQPKAKSRSKSEKKAGTAPAARKVYQSLDRIGSNVINDDKSSSVNSDGLEMLSLEPLPTTTKPEAQAHPAPETARHPEATENVDISRHPPAEALASPLMQVADTSAEVQPPIFSPPPSQASLPSVMAQPPVFDEPTPESPLPSRASLPIRFKSEAVAPSTIDAVSSFNPPEDTSVSGSAALEAAISPVVLAEDYHSSPQTQPTLQRHPANRTSPGSSETPATLNQVSALNQNHIGAQHDIDLEGIGDQSAASTMGDASESSASISVPTNLLQPTQDEQPTRFRSLANTEQTATSSSLPAVPDLEATKEEQTLLTEAAKDTAFNMPPPKGYAVGGQVTASYTPANQYIAPSDTVPAMLTPGEFVINATNAQKNLNLLQHINTGGTVPDSVETSTIESAKANSVQRNSDTNLPRALGSLVPSSLGLNTEKSLSTLSSVQSNPLENKTTELNERSTHYSSTPLIFRKQTTTTDSPSQWSSIENLLSGSRSAASTKPKSSRGSTNYLPQPRGFATGGEVTAPNTSTPITETIKRPSSEPQEADPSDLELLAREIYHRLRQRLELERERHGIYSGRLPW